MHRFLILAVLAATLAPAPSGWAQSPSAPRFGVQTDTGIKPVAGTITVRVGTDTTTLTRADGMTYALRISRTGETFPCDTFPYTLRFDSKTVADGWCWLEILLVSPDPATAPKVIDSLKLFVRNDKRTPLPVVPAPEPAPIETPRQPSRPLSSRGRGNAHAPRLLTLPDTVPVQVLDATVAESAAPMSVPRVSQIVQSGATVYLGLPDGGVAAWDETAKRGFVVRVSGASPGAVRALAVGNGKIGRASCRERVCSTV